jgi:hypothetical protein
MPTPPDVRSQGQPAGPGGDGAPAIMKAQQEGQQGPGPQDAIQNVQKAMDAFEKSTSDLYQVIKEMDPQAEAMFPQMIEWGKALKDRVQQLAQKAGQGAATPQPAQPATNPAEAPPGPAAMPQAA